MLVLSSLFIIIFSSIVSAQAAQTTQAAAQQPYCPIAVYEGDVVKLSPEAYDPDKEIGPAGMLLWSISPPFNETAAWKTTKGKRGIFPFWVKVSDGELSDTEYSCIQVLPRNRNPVLEPLKDMTITRGKDATFYATCSDPDNDTVKIEYFLNGKNMQYILYWPAGRYWITAVCTDGYGGAAWDSALLTIKEPIDTTTAKPKKQTTIPALPEQIPQTPVPIEITAPEKVTVNEPIIIEDNESKNPCEPCACTGSEDNIEVVVHERAYPLTGEAGATREFVLEARPTDSKTTATTTPADIPAKTAPGKQYAPVNKPAVKTPSTKKVKTALERKLEVNAAYNCECPEK